MKAINASGSFTITREKFLNELHFFEIVYGITFLTGENINLLDAKGRGRLNALILPMKWICSSFFLAANSQGLLQTAFIAEKEVEAKEDTFIVPSNMNNMEHASWINCMNYIENARRGMREIGSSPRVLKSLDMNCDMQTVLLRMTLPELRVFLRKYHMNVGSRSEYSDIAYTLGQEILKKFPELVYWIWELPELKASDNPCEK